MIADEKDATARQDPAGPSMVPILRGLLLDVGLPVLVYYALHLLGADDWVALLAGTGAAALRIVWVAVAHRSFNHFAAIMLVVYGFSLLLALVTGDPRLLLLKGSFITAGIGTVFLVTAFGRRPLTLSAAQSFQPAQARQIAEEYRSDPHVRRGHRVSSTVWGLGLFADALLRLPVIFLLPIPVATGLSEGMLIAAFVLLMAWNAWYVRRAQSAAGPGV